MHNNASDQGTDAPGNSTATLATAIGNRVRYHRQARGWTLDQIAEAAGVSRRMIINVEQGTANPSVGTLLKISDALGIGLPALVEAPRNNIINVTPDGDGVTLWSSESGGRGVLVATVDSNDVVELWDWTLAPGDMHTSHAHSRGSRELIHVLQGAVVVDVADQSVTLETGDAASFSGDVPHAYRNTGTHPAQFSLAVFEPDTGSGTASENSDA